MLLDSLDAISYLTKMLNKYKILDYSDINFTGDLTKENIEYCVKHHKQNKRNTNTCSKYYSNVLPNSHNTKCDIDGIEALLIKYLSKYYVKLFNITNIKNISNVSHAICENYNYASDIELLIGSCKRVEAVYTKYRLNEFKVLELVFKYNKWDGDVYSNAIIKFIQMFDRISYNVEFANDTFLSNSLNRDALIKYQNFTKVKKEILLLTTEDYIAIASINDHKNINVNKYNLNTLGTGCASIGISRLARVLLEYYNFNELCGILKYEN